jgi:hypothetical protein
MYPKCSLSDSNIYLQIVGLLSLVIIIIIAGFYYIRVYHNTIKEKYEQAVIYKTEGQLETGNRSTFPRDKYPGAQMNLIGTNTPPTTTDKYELRDCKVYFTDDTGACDGKGDDAKTCSYKYDGWQEFATYTDNNGKIIEYPKKIYKQDASNTNELINSYFTSKCFKKFDNNGDGRPQPFEYKENNLVKYDSKGSTNNTEIDTNVFGGKKYTSMQFLNTTSPSDNFNNVIDSICSIRYNPIKELVGKKFYKFVLDANKNIRQILKVQLNSDQTTFDIINNNAVLDFSFLGSHGLKFVSANSNQLEVFITSADIVRPVNVYKFSYVSYICPPDKKAQISNFLKTSTEINITNFIQFGGESQTATSANNPFTLDYLDRLTASKYTIANTDYKTAMLKELADKRDAQVTKLNGVSSAEKDALDKKITDKDAEIFAADRTRNSYYIPEGTFTKVIDLTKANSKIFNYNNGYNNTNLSKLVIPTGCEVIMIENTGDVCFVFKNKGDNQTSYDFSVPASGYTCDILLVGGGGAGGHFGGGGGGGGILLGENITFNSNSSVSIKVGNGGIGANAFTNYSNGTNGFDTSITINLTEYIATGGGGGGTRDNQALGKPGNAGGSGGGGSHSNNTSYPGMGGASNKKSYAGFQSFGNNGGRGRPTTGGSAPDHASGGGGGAGSVGGDFSYSTGGGNGGTGKEFISYFGSSIGHNGYFAGGGGGNTYQGGGNRGYGNGGNGLLGGGGSGGLDWGNSGENSGDDGLPNTGGGGGGGKWDGGSAEDINGGHGGSGIVIIRIKNIIPRPPDINSAIDKYYSINSITDVSLASNTIQSDIITAFVFLQKGYYRFRADLGTNTNGANPSIKYAQLMIYDESNFDRSTLKYRCVPVFRYNGQFKPAYLKQYVYIPTSKFFKIAYFYLSHNPSSIDTSPFKMYYDYSTAPQQQTYPEDIISSPNVSSNTINNTDKLMIFNYGGSGTTKDYTFTPTEDLICDILIVGGGGGGGKFGGGGGGGAILLGTNIAVYSNNRISIKVGNGGSGGTGNDSGINGMNGVDSSITINSVEYIAKGGGGGGTRGYPSIGFPGINGNSGGSGGGGSHANSGTQGLGGISNKNNYSNFQSFGNNGGKGRPNTNGGDPNHSSGGGGGAGSAGADFSYSTGGGNGGAGKEFIAYFGSSAGHNGWFSGGGGGNTYRGAGNGGYGNGGNGLLGGGGQGGHDDNNSAVAGLANTGGGGGGGRYFGTNSNGGMGGSGTVIIRYRLQSQRTAAIPLKDLNDNMNDSPDLYVSKNITNNIKTSMNDYLYYSSTLYNDYKNTDTTVMDIFSIMNYIGNNKNNYRYLATYLNNKVDYFNTDKLLAEKKEFQRQLQTHINNSSTTITGDQEIIKIDNLSNNIKAINYNEKKPMNAPILRNVPIKDIFCESNNNIYLTYDTITNLNGINLLTPNLTPAIYIEAIT